MSSEYRMPETTERSSHIGLPGYDNQKDWQHFCDKYRDRIIRFASQHYRTYADLIEDTWQDMTVRIYTNPHVLSRKPSIHFRSALIRLYRITFADNVRKLKEKQFAKFTALSAPLRNDHATQETDIHRFRLLAIDLIERDMMRPDYENGRYSKEYDTFELDVYQALQAPDATNEKVAEEFGIKPWIVQDIKSRMKTRIAKEAENLLLSLGLL